eukprot:398776-Pleurochrysis_carterae.AAC.2
MASESTRASSFDCELLSMLRCSRGRPFICGGAEERGRLCIRASVHASAFLRPCVCSWALACVTVACPKARVSVCASVSASMSAFDFASSPTSASGFYISYARA